MVPDPQNAAAPPSGRGTLMVLLLAFLLYLPSVQNGFAMDDTPIAHSDCNTSPGPDPVITAEFDSGALDYLGKFFTHHYWWPESHNDGLYRPMSVLSYGLVYQLVGRHLPADFEGAPQHAINVLLHVWAVWLVIRLLVTLGAGGFVSLLTALLFGVHAIHSEVVAGIIGRAEIFSFCFGAQALLWMTRGGVWRNVLAGALLFFAYGSKESSLAWIPFYFCYQLARQWLRDPDGDPWLPFKGARAAFAGVVLLLPCALFFLLRYPVMNGGEDKVLDLIADPSSNPLVYVTDGVRIMTAIKVWGFAMWLCVAPFELSCLYSPVVFDMVESPLDPGFLGASIALGALLVSGLTFARRLPLLFLAMTCFLGFSFITSNVPLPIGTILGERLYYVPSLGICLLPALVLPLLCRIGMRVFLVCVALWCAGNAAMTAYRTQLWKDSKAVFLHDSETYPESIDLHRKSAQCLMFGTDAEVAQAIEHVQTAIEAMPNYTHGHRLLGDIYMRQKKFQQAIASYEQAFGQGYPEPPGAESIAFNKIGDCLVGLSGEAKGEDEKNKLLNQAVEWFEKSLEAPEWGDSHGDANNRIGDCHIEYGQLALSPADKTRSIREALRWYQRTLELHSKLPNARATGFKRIFEHAFLEDERLMSKERLFELYGLAHAYASDHELALMMGAMAYKAGFPTEMVYSPLHWALPTYPKEKRNETFYKAHLFYSDALIERGETGKVRQIFEMLLGVDQFPADLKARLRQRLASDPNLR